MYTYNWQGPVAYMVKFLFEPIDKNLNMYAKEDVRVLLMHWFLSYQMRYFPLSNKLRFIQQSCLI